MRVLASARTAPARLAARLYHADREAGMTTAEYAVGTANTPRHLYGGDHDDQCRLPSVMHDRPRR